MADKGKCFPLGERPRGYAFRGGSLTELTGRVEEPVLRIGRGSPPEPGETKYATVVLEAVPTGHGPLRRVLALAYDHLAPGGDLYLRLGNRRSWARVQELLQGHPVVYAPAGCGEDPLLAVDREELARDLHVSGLVAREIVTVPGMAGPVPEEHIAHLWEQDLDAAILRQEGRAEWYLVHARREEPLAGSVIVAAGNEGDTAATERHLATILPPRWEVITVRPEAGEEPTECELWCRGVPRSRGDRLAFLRAGQRPEALWLQEAIPQLFHRGRLVVPADETDLAGLVITRRDLLALGTLPWHRHAPNVAREEFLLWAGQRARQAVTASRPIPGPGPGPTRPAEVEDFLDTLGYLQRPSQVVARRRDEAVSPWEGRAPRISLCMITRDEEEFLDRCLRSVAPFVDEIIIADTGSTDGTVAIAQSHGARVIHESWRDDFARARNASLAPATGDWILVLDADEEFEPGSGEAMRQAVTDPTILAYHLHFRNTNEDGTETNGVRMIRLFRNLEGVEYERRIHEQVIHSLMRSAEGMELGVGSASIGVRHHGYSHKVMKTKGKKNRNWELFEKQVEDDPEDFYSWYKFGDFMRRFGTPELVKEKLGRALELILELPESELRSVPYAAEVCTLLALEESLGGDQQRAHELLRLAMDRFMRTPNTYYIAGGVAVRLGNVRLGLEYYDHCLAFRDRVLVVPIEDGLGDYASWYATGVAWSQLGFPHRALEYLEASLVKKPDYLPALLGLSSHFLQQGQPARALEVLTWFLQHKPEVGVAWEQGANIMVRLGLLDRAAEWCHRAAGCDERSWTTDRLAGEIRLLQGDLEGAGRCWERMDQPAHAAAARWVIGALSGRSGEPTEPLDEAAGWVEGLILLLGRQGHDRWGAGLRAALAGMASAAPIGAGGGAG